MRKTLLASLALVSALGMTLTACGQPASQGGGTADGKLEKTSLNVGVLPLADYAAVYWAKDHGYFDKAGLDVTLTPIQGGPIGIQQAVAGQLDLSFSNTVSSAIAVEGGAPVTTVVLTSSLGPQSLGVFVKADSPVKAITDLDGKTIGINTTNTIGDVTFRNLVSSQGLNVAPSWVEVPFNEMIAGVQAGSVEAGYLPEPFASAAEKAGLRRVVDLSSGPNAGLPISTFVASNNFVKDNPDTTAAFVDAVYAAGKDITGKEADFRQWLPSIAKVPAEVAGTMALPHFETAMSVEKVQSVADILIKQDIIKKFDAGKSTYTTPGKQ
ncbi:sulfonate ABC transporter substrate-binding protein [Arthrobacter sp. StoSoilB3]|nr:sulfonate ABC transporter substrate-binding protein [Arthrobacter sp. StoSoilB3]